ncbi:MAG: hypothetical protein SFU56_13760 [Capsulimonadales bacterium]|nr:hypothetical protein [Capsulimonadales bacterium]
MKLSTPVFIGIIVAVVLAVVAIGFYATRQATGGALADEIHASMAKQSGKPPMGARPGGGPPAGAPPAGGTAERR